MKHLTILLLTCATFAVAAEEGLVTTWRGPNYDGVMPATNLPTSFVWYDDDAPLIDDAPVGMLDPIRGGRGTATLPHQPRRAQGDTPPKPLEPGPAPGPEPEPVANGHGAGLGWSRPATCQNTVPKGQARTKAGAGRPQRPSPARISWLNGGMA